MLRLATAALALLCASNLNAQCGSHTASSTPYNGSGVNQPNTLRAFNTPVLGSPWTLLIDHSSFLPGATVDFYVFALDPAQILFAPYGEILVDQTFNVTIWGMPGQPLAFTVPNDTSLCAASLYAQGASWDGGSTILLTSAVDGECGDS